MWVASWLRDQGHEVVHAAIDHSGAKDAALLEIARRENRILLTFDRDFGELLFRRRLAPPRGVVLFRLGRLSASARRIVVRSFFESDSELAGCFTVVVPGEIRRSSIFRT